MLWQRGVTAGMVGRCCVGFAFRMIRDRMSEVVEATKKTRLRDETGFLSLPSVGFGAYFFRDAGLRPASRSWAMSSVPLLTATIDETLNGEPSSFLPGSAKRPATLT